MLGQVHAARIATSSGDRVTVVQERTRIMDALTLRYGLLHSQM
jgi:hypothetical protein